MKNILFSLILLLVFNLSFSQTPWTRVAPSIQEHTVNKLFCLPGTSKVFGACDGSTIIKSANAGQTWDVILHPAQMNAGFSCKSIVFIEESTGFIGGSGLTILKTVNGGNTWSKKFESEPIFGQDAFNDIAFFNNSTGVAVAHNGEIIRTTDGGESWDILESGQTIDLQGVKVLNDSTAYAIGYSDQMLKTTDRGLTWFVIPRPSNFPEGRIQDLIFVNNTSGFVLITYSDYSNSFHYVLKTTDGGLSWTESLMDPQVVAYDGCFAAFDAEHVAIVSTMWAYHCQVTFTDNGGTTWTELEQDLPWNQYALCYTDDHSLIAGGTLGMLFNSNDGGYNWNVLNQRQIENSVLDVQFVTNTTGFLLSESYGGGVPGQVLYKTTNGGLNWNPVSESGHVYFLDSFTGFMIQGSYFQKTTDGGNSWQFVTEIENITSNFSDIKFYDQMRGMIAGEEILMCTTDGGLTWQDISPGIHNYNDIEYKTADLVYVTLSDYQNSVILSTPDHGTSWQQINAGEYGNANDLLLLNNDTAFLVCSYPAILRSTDACLTWQPMVINSTAQIKYNSISFPDDLNGYVVGSGENYGGNILLKTMDGGLTWNPIESFVTSGLTQVHFFNNDTGLIFGKNGVVLSTSTGGIVSTANVEPPKAEPLLFSPNPFTTELHINNSQYSPSMIVITDVTGRRVLSKTISGESHSIDTSSLKPGIYTITFFENEKRISASKGIRL